MGLTTAEQLVELLKSAGIKRIYGVTGDSLNFLNDALRRDGTIEWIHVRHEEAGAFAAMAEGVLGGFSCCAGSSGPGHVSIYLMVCTMRIGGEHRYWLWHQPLYPKIMVLKAFNLLI